MHECHQKCQMKNTEICCKRIVTGGTETRKTNTKKIYCMKDKTSVFKQWDFQETHEIFFFYLLSIRIMKIPFQLINLFLFFFFFLI